MQTLLDAYNDVVRAIDSQSKAIKGADGKLTSGVFSGDVVPRQIRSSLASKIATSVAGTYKTLAEIGITTGKDGTLSLDAVKFQKALNDNAPAVSTLAAGTSTMEGIADLLWAATDAATKAVTGTIAARQDGITTNIKNVQKQIDNALLRLDAVERSLRTRFTNLEKTVSRIQSTGDSLLSQLASLEKASSSK
jgi:flagellar hook-associated protein 2